MIFIDVHTKIAVYAKVWEDRKTSLGFSEDHPELGVMVVGEIPHGAKLIVDQKLVDDLQHLVEMQELCK